MSRSRVRSNGPVIFLLKPALLVIAMLGPSVCFAQTTQSALLPERSQISRTELFRKSDSSIARGVKYLLSRQNPDGSWTSDQNGPDLTGSTALVTLALLYCGESHQSPPLDRAIKYLKKGQPQKYRYATYSIALRACVYASLPEALRKNELVADLRWLQQAIIAQGPRRGMYDYNLGRTLGGDYSNSQYGVLGVWYAAQAGLEVPRAYWQQVESGWLAGQNEDGGWAYRPGRVPSYSSMTAAATATLFITNDYLHWREAEDLSKTTPNKPLEAAMKWVAENFRIDQNVGLDVDTARQRRPDQDVMDLLGELGRNPGIWIHYMLFGFERVGEASGFTHFGEHKWFDEGADYLIRTQSYDGSWAGDNRVGTEGNTAYALLFLSRGRSPVVIQKLQYSGRWNNRPRDAANFAYFLRRASERHVNWQIVSTSSTPEELRESPLLYMTGDRAVKLSSSEKVRLKEYIDQGGLLVCVNEGRIDQFAQSILALGAELYPACKFRDLPENHLIYSANFSAEKTEGIQGLGNGLRELIVLYPGGDMSWKWHAAAGAFHPRTTPYASLANLWLYVTDRANPRFKGEDTWVTYDRGVTPTRSAKLARIRHDGNWDPEPGGWERLVNIMHNFDQFELRVDTTTNPSGAALAHLTDTGSLRLTTELQQSLKGYVNGGGLLLLDAAGGSPEAAGTLDLVLRQLFSDVILAPLPLDHPIYHARPFGGLEIDSVQYRRAQNFQPVKVPRLRGATVNGKLIAIVSAEDLSGGLVGYSTAGLTGYVPASATDLVRNIILWRTSAMK